MTDIQIRNRYLLHTILHKFTEELFFAFGALLIYAKTNSVLITLLFVVIGHLGTVFIKSAGFGPSVALLRKWGLVPSMTFGLILKVLALVSIFYLDPGLSYFYPVLFSLNILEGLGNTLYVIGASTIMIEVIGASKAPGRSSAQILALHTLSGLAAAIVGIFLNAGGSFLYLFLVGAVILLGSTVPLSGIPTPDLPKLSFRKNLRTISLPMFLANVNPNHQFKVTGLPLVILALSASFSASVWIVAGVAAMSIFAAYVAGWIRDHHGTWLIWLSLGIGIVCWGAYGFISSPLSFLLVSILLGLATEVLSVSREARMGPELHDNLIGGTMAFEFARAFGALIGSSLLLIAYLFAGSLPQSILMIGGLFLIPKAIYGAGRGAAPSQR